MLRVIVSHLQVLEVYIRQQFRLWVNSNAPSGTQVIANNRARA